LAIHIIDSLKVKEKNTVILQTAGYVYFN
jgi:hypothetical protein